MQTTAGTSYRRALPTVCCRDFVKNCKNCEFYESSHGIKNVGGGTVIMNFSVEGLTLTFVDMSALLLCYAAYIGS
jgi:hypothetical protein